MANTLKQIAAASRGAVRLMISGADRLRDLLDLGRRTFKTAEEAVKGTTVVAKQTATLYKDVQGVRSEVRALRAELRERLLQYNLQLGRLSRSTAGEVEDPQLSGRTFPLSIEDGQEMEWETIAARELQDPQREWLTLDACAVCGCRERTIVQEFNKLVLLKKAPDESSARYDYAMCHACGMVYATRRPYGARYQFLLDNFGEVTAKQGESREIKNPLLNPYPLSSEDQEHLKQLASKGVFVSDHQGLRTVEYLDGLLKDRFENSVHVDVIGSLLNPRGARVLELRPRTGAISESLRRLFGAEVYGMPIWESQHFLLKEVYGIETRGLVNYDRFEIPFEGKFDLIVGNHMITHVIRPAEFFATLRERLKPGGHIYLFNEPDDAEFLSGSQSMLTVLNPLHMQAFDHPSLTRGLAANGFRVVFQKRRNVNHLVLAQMGDAPWTPMSDSDRNRRLRAYTRAHDRAILAVPEDVRPRFAAEWPAVIERGVAEGVAEFDANGRLRLVAR